MVLLDIFAKKGISLDMNDDHKDCKNKQSIILDLDEKQDNHDISLTRNNYIIHGVSIAPYEIIKAIECGQAGDAFLFTKVFKNTYRYDHRSKAWYIFDNHSWRLDMMVQAVKDMNVLSHLYKKESLRQYERIQELKTEKEPMPTALRITEQRYADLINRRNQINSLSYRKDVLNLASFGQDSLGLTSSDWDRYPWLLACGNGILNLTDFTMKQAHPGDLIRTSTPTFFQGLNEQSPMWQLFINKLFNDDIDQAAYFQKMIGHCLAGSHCNIPVFFVSGPLTFSTYFFLKILSSVLGDHMSSMGLFSKSSHLSLVLNPQGKRLVWEYVSAERQQQAFNAIFDYINQCDELNRKFSSFVPGIFLVSDLYDSQVSDSNVIQQALSRTYGHNLITLNFSPCEDLVSNPAFQEKLLQESPGILSWVIKGAHLSRTQGLDVPERTLDLDR